MLKAYFPGHSRFPGLFLHIQVEPDPIEPQPSGRIRLSGSVIADKFFISITPVPIKRAQGNFETTKVMISSEENLEG